MSRPNILTNETQRDLFVQACLALKAEPIQGTPYSFYDYFPHWHFTAMNVMTPQGQMARNAAHGGPSFGPWHRLMLLVFESVARQVLGNNNFELPYWDWAADADAPGNSPIWDASIMGGNGDAFNNNAVLNGPFRAGEFSVVLTDSLNPGQWTQVPPRALRRQFYAFANELSDQTDINQSKASFPFYERWPYNNSVSSFRTELEIPLHNTVHRFVGGDMMTSASPNDPVFFLHHCNIDRIWASWQADYPSVSYVPSETASAELFMHRLGDPMYNNFGINLPISAMVNYRDYYEYDSLA